MFSKAKMIGIIASLGLSSAVLAGPAPKAKAPAVKAKVPTSAVKGAVGAAKANTGFSSPSAVMRVPATQNKVHKFGTGTNTGSAVIEDAENITVDANLTGSQASKMKAGLATEEVLQAMYAAQGNLIDSANDVNPAKEDALQKFSDTAADWVCGDSCINTVIASYEAGTMANVKAVDAGKAVDVGHGLISGLKANGILDEAKGACKRELGALIGG